MYTEVSGQKLNTLSDLSSPIFAARQGDHKCFSFYYHMDGADIGSLTVLIAEGSRTKQLFAKSGHQGTSTWQIQKLDVSPTGNFKMIFRSRSGKSYRGDIAVDQMVLTNAPCGGKYKHTYFNI